VATKPAVTTGGVRNVMPTTATLTGSVNPHAAETTYHFEWGPSSSYGQRTADTGAGSGTTSLSVSAGISGLQPGKRYHYRLVAANSQGTTTGGDRSFVAATTPTGASLGADHNPVVYGQPVTLTGKLTGSKISGVKVRLRITPFPFSAPFADFGSTVNSDKSGNYTFKIPLVTWTTRAVVLAEGRPGITSNVVLIRCAVRTGITSVQRTRSRVVVSGRLTPVTPNGVAALQRQASNGQWVPLRRAHIGSDGRYAIGMRPRRKPMLVRVVGLPHDGGAHYRGTSRIVKIAGRRAS
jgi:hypothetical protein